MCTYAICSTYSTIADCQVHLRTPAEFKVFSPQLFKIVTQVSFSIVLIFEMECPGTRPSPFTPSISAKQMQIWDEFAALKSRVRVVRILSPFVHPSDNDNMRIQPTIKAKVRIEIAMRVIKTHLYHIP